MTLILFFLLIIHSVWVGSVCSWIILRSLLLLLWSSEQADSLAYMLAAVMMDLAVWQQLSVDSVLFPRFSIFRMIKKTDAHISGMN